MTLVAFSSSLIYVFLLLYEVNYSCISPEMIKKKGFVCLYAKYSKKRLFYCLPNVASSKNYCAGPFIDIDEIPFSM